MRDGDDAKALAALLRGLRVLRENAMLSLQPSSAHFVAWYMELKGTVINPPIEVVLIKSPAPFSLK